MLSRTLGSSIIFTSFSPWTRRPSSELDGQGQKASHVTWVIWPSLLAHPCTRNVSVSTRAQRPPWHTCVSRGEGCGEGSTFRAGCVEGSEPEAMRKALSLTHSHLQNGMTTDSPASWVCRRKGETRPHALATSETVEEEDVGVDCAKLTVTITGLVIMYFLSFL